MWWLLILSLVIFFRGVGYSGECTGNFDDYQFDMIDSNMSHHLFPERHGKILTLGLLESAIRKLKSKFPLLQIIPIDDELFAELEEFYTRDENGHHTFENRYDAIIVFLALEKNPHREAKLLLMYNALKPKKKGAVFFTPKGAYSLDHWVEKFLEGNPSWRKLLSNVSTLSLGDYQSLIQNTGFFIVEERKWAGILHNSDTSQWVCDRWAVPSPMRSFFHGDFYRFLNATFKNHPHVFLDVHSFLIEKIDPL